MGRFDGGNDRGTAVCLWRRDDLAQEYDGYVFGTPVYYAGMNGSLKAFMDRVFFLICGDGETRLRSNLPLRSLLQDVPGQRPPMTRSTNILPTTRCRLFHLPIGIWPTE